MTVNDLLNTLHIVEKLKEYGVNTKAIEDKNNDVDKIYAVLENNHK